MIVVNDKFRDRKALPLRRIFKKFKFKKRLVLGHGNRQRVVNIAHIYVRSVFTNYFITLTDLQNKVVLSLSTGQVSKGKNQKKRKLSYDNIMRLVNKLIRKLKFLHIKCVYIIQRSSKNWRFRTLLWELQRHRIIVVSIILKKIVAHNGVYARDRRRV